MKQAIQRVAHRGGSHLAPENTLAAFSNALNFPIDAIELDVHMSRDGHAIVFHDNTVERLTDGKGNILDLDFAYLRSLNAAAHFPGGWPTAEQTPTLNEVLNFAKGRVKVNIEIKRSNRGSMYGFYPGIVEAVLNEVRAADLLEQVFVLSFGWPMLQELKSLEPSIPVGALIRDEQWIAYSDVKNVFDVIMSQVTALGCDWINILHHLYTDSMIDAAHKCGFKLGVWSVNEKDELYRLSLAGVDSLTSDRPDLFAYL
ncbi:MAG TPA: glycerophosphodiester phosphodiesterase family protein [Ktedonobacteraceae bacterium]|nr:glycerophosphodiester phosphodiesterase family protein [Ktedonobacteraceae bacterium]